MPKTEPAVIFLICLLILFMSFALGWTLQGYTIYSSMFKNTVNITEIRK